MIKDILNTLKQGMNEATCCKLLADQIGATFECDEINAEKKIVTLCAPCDRDDARFIEINLFFVNDALADFEIDGDEIQFDADGVAYFV